MYLLMGLQVHALLEGIWAANSSVRTALLLGIYATTIALVVRSGGVAAFLWALARRARRGPELREQIEHVPRGLAAGQLHQQVPRRLGSCRRPPGPPISLPPRPA